MTQQRDIERLLDQWLGDGPSEAPDRVLVIVAERIERRSQRPAWRFIWRQPHVNALLKPLAALAAVVVVALIGLSLIGGTWRFGLGGPGPTALPGSSPTIAPSQTSGPRVDVPPGFASRMTPADVEQVTLAILADEVRAIGTAIVPARVTAIRLIPPGVSVPLESGNGFGEGSFSSPTITWAVDYEGTFRPASPCWVATVGTLILEDATGDLRTSAAHGPTTRVPCAPAPRAEDPHDPRLPTQVQELR